VVLEGSGRGLCMYLPWVWDCHGSSQIEAVCYYDIEAVWMVVSGGV
jgi:hypothetical protein